MSSRSRRPLSIVIALGSLLLLLNAANAAAATRFAAPGGTAPAASSCALANPCSLFNAASEAAPNTALGSGDEVVVAPGNYSDTANDLGPNGSVLLEEDIALHGAAGQLLPVVSINTNAGAPAFVVQSGDTFSHVEITSTALRNDIFVEAGTVEGVVARSSGHESLVCGQTGGIIRDSACLSSGTEDVALGVALVVSTPATFTAKLRNVTAVSTGTGSRGLNYTVIGESNFTVDAVGVIARSPIQDVFASGLSVSPHTPGTGANVEINLAHSDYADKGIGSDAAGANPIVTPPRLSDEHHVAAALCRRRDSRAADFADC